MTSIPSIKSPLRYPGGKSRALKKILPTIPSFHEYREPMVGGGSVFFALKQLYPHRRFWINDINTELYLFWKYCKEDINKLQREVRQIKKEHQDGRALYYFLKNHDDFSVFERAVRFFVLNRITFSGLAESGGYSSHAFKSRFTDSSIDRLGTASEILQGAHITNEDYEKIVNAEGESVFIFLDPPYLSKTKSNLYGKNGVLHKSFDHERFAKIIKKCKHKWLITYDDCQEVRNLFASTKGIYIYEWELQYGMNNYKQENAIKGKELFISNYEITITKEENKQLFLFNFEESAISSP